MTVNYASSEMEQAWQQVRAQWQKAGGVWNDAVRWQFEREFWQPLESLAPATIQEIERLAQVIAQARQNVR